MTDASETHVRLREYIERILDERDRRNDAQEKALDARLDALNRLREQVTQDRGMYLTRDVYEQMNADLTRRVLKSENTMARFQGIGLALIVISGILGAVVGALVSHMLK